MRAGSYEQAPSRDSPWYIVIISLYGLVFRLGDDAMGPARHYHINYHTMDTDPAADPTSSPLEGRQCCIDAGMCEVD